MALKEANADVPNFSGIYLPGRNWYAVLSFIWENGGDIATKEGDEWVGQLDSAGSIAGLEYFKELFDTANSAPADGDDANDYIAFCNGEVGMMPAPGWKPGQIINPDDGCPDMEAQHRRVRDARHRGRHDGTGLPRRIEPRRSRSTARTQELAYDLLKILVSPGFQEQFAEPGTIPALKSELAERQGSDAAVAQARRRQNSRFVPTSEKWAGVEAANILPDMLAEIAQGGDIAAAAAAADAAIEDHAQRLDSLHARRRAASMAVTTTTSPAPPGRVPIAPGRTADRRSPGDRRRLGCCPTCWSSRRSSSSR